jgi:hypothetical protein
LTSSGGRAAGDGGARTLYNLGNVGIGTLNPTAKLDVSGDVTASLYKISGMTVLSASGYSTFVGKDAGTSNTTGAENTFLGYQAGYKNTTGNYNTFLGVATGYKNIDGYFNAFIGEQAGYYNEAGHENTYSGVAAGYKNTGSYNTFLGYAAGYNNTGSGNVFIGNRAGFDDTTGSYRLYIANSSGTPLIYGDFSTGRVGIGTTNPTEMLHVNGNIIVASSSRGTRLRYYGPGDSTEGLFFESNWGGSWNPKMIICSQTGRVGMGVTTPSCRLQLPNTADAGGQGLANAWTTYSSKRWKTNIQPIKDALEKVEGLRGVYFDWKSNGKHDIGLIAEEVAEVIPEVVGYEENGKDASSLDYARLVALLVEAVKEQQQKIHALQTALEENELLKRRIDGLEGKIERLQLLAVKEMQQ